MTRLVKSSLVLISFFLLQGVCRAAWVDDWINQKTVHGPTTMEDQKRGYASAGGVNMRWANNKDYLLTIAKPRFSSGCGGIDVFLGGMGYTKMKYLGEKFKNIMTHSMETYLFDISMNLLCEPCAKEFKSLSALIDRLNQLNLDDCKAQKAVVAIMKDHTPGSLAGPAETEAVSNFLVDSGLEQYYKDVISGGENATADQALAAYGATKASMVSGCPPAMQNTFFKAGSVLENLANERGIAVGYIELIRGLVGDIEVSPNLDYNYLDPCSENRPERIAEFMYGEMYQRTKNTNVCEKLSSFIINGHTYGSIREYVSDMMVGIADNLVAKSPLTNDQTTFVSALPGSIYMGLKQEVEKRGESTISADVVRPYSEIAASAYTYAMITDLYETTSQVINTAETIAKNKQGTDSGGGQKDCQLQLAQGAITSLGRMKEKIRAYKIAVTRDYDMSVNQYVAYLAMGQGAVEAKRQIENERMNEVHRGRIKSN